MHPIGGVALGWTNVRAKQLWRNPKLGVALDGLALQRIVAVRGPESIGMHGHAVIDSSAPGRTALNLESRATSLELIEHSVDGKGLVSNRCLVQVTRFDQELIVIPFNIGNVAGR